MNVNEFISGLNLYQLDYCIDVAMERKAKLKDESVYVWEVYDGLSIISDFKIDEYPKAIALLSKLAIEDWEHIGCKINRELEYSIKLTKISRDEYIGSFGEDPPEKIVA